MSNDDDITEKTGEMPVVSPVDPRVTVTGADIAGEVVDIPIVEESILPHWTEAPTGQVPAVLTRDSSSEDDPWASIPAPAWREGEADWVAHDEQFDHSMLTGETAAVDARPWEFDDTTEPAVNEEVLAETPRPGPTRPHRTRRPAPTNPLAGRAARATAEKNVLLATMTGVLIAATVVVLFLIGNVAVLILVCAALITASLELFAAFRKVGAHPATLLGLVATLALSIAAYNKGESAIGLVTALFLFFVVLWYMGAETKVDVLDGIGATVFVYVWIGIIGSFAALMISPINYPNKHGLSFLLGTIVIVVFNDTGALFTGRFFGKHKLAPSISPGKTVEGLVGGTVASICVAGVIGQASSLWGFKNALIIGVAIAIVTPIGDLFESMVKRTLGVKDMGGLLPGHGGMLDRVDGLLFALPATYYLVHVLHMG